MQDWVFRLVELPMFTNGEFHNPNDTTHDYLECVSYQIWIECYKAGRLQKKYNFDPQQMFFRQIFPQKFKTTFQFFHHFFDQSVIIFSNFCRKQVTFSKNTITVRRKQGTWEIFVKYRSEEKGSSLCKCSILLGFLCQKNQRGCVLNFYQKIKSQTSQVF